MVRIDDGTGTAEGIHVGLWDVSEVAGFVANGAALHEPVISAAWS
jgi:hypothetical protein